MTADTTSRNSADRIFLSSVLELVGVCCWDEAVLNFHRTPPN
jgi:hypothetical protein